MWKACCCLLPVRSDRGLVRDRRKQARISLRISDREKEKANGHSQEMVCRPQRPESRHI